MADNPKNNSIDISNQETLQNILNQLQKDSSIKNSLSAAEKSIFQQHFIPVEGLDKKIKETEVQIKKLDNRLGNLASNSAKLEKAMQTTSEFFGKSSEQYLDVAESYKNVGEKLKETVNRIDYAESYLETAQELLENTARVALKANEKFQQDKKEISRTMSDITRDVNDEIILARQNMIQYARLYEQDKEAYEQKHFESINTWQEAIERRNELQALEFKYLSTQEKQESLKRASSQYLDEKKDLDLRRDAGELSDENYNILLQELNKQFFSVFQPLLNGDIKELLVNITNGTFGAGLSSALSISPIGKAILMMGDVLKNISTTINKFLSQGVSDAINLAGEYLGSIDARLQGTPLLDNGQGFGIYERLNQSLIRSFAASPFVNQKELMQNINRFVDQGISWNVEQRALITTLSEKMVTTFDALDASLTRLIRVQGADLTASSMGAEAQLTKFLNTNFQDTSYLNSLYDSVNAAVLDASAQLNYEGAIGFNYAVQKWLASLYSVGMSESGVQTIAQGLNYLATGNADALAGNSSLQNLLALSATNAGLNYADLLKTGLNADKTDMLLESMVRYLQGIYSNIGNNVVKSAWSNIAGLSVTDLRSIANLSQTEISNIASSDITYGNALTEFKNQLSKVEERTTIQEMANTLLDNVMLSFGNTLIGMANGDGTWSASGDFSSISDLLSNIVPYITWNIGERTGGTFGAVSKLASLASNLFGDIFQSEEEADKYSIWDLAGTLVSQYQDNYLSPTQGLEFLWNPQVSDNPWFFNEKTNALTLKDRALNYIPLLGAVASSDMKQLTSSGTDLGTSTNELSTMVGEAAAAANKALSSTSSSSGMSEGTSFAMTNASTESERSMSLSNNDLVSAETSSVTGTSSEITTRTVYDLYEKLFEKRDTPIRVQLAEIEEVVTKSLQQFLISDMANDVKYLANQAAGTGINVDLGAEDASLMKSQIYSVKYL